VKIHTQCNVVYGLEFMAQYLHACFTVSRIYYENIGKELFRMIDDWRDRNRVVSGSGLGWNGATELISASLSISSLDFSMAMW
jgi:hypothetical protein